ncbi:hypothetical protein ABYF32_04275 [Buchananella felis]|uniref:hypothetical protein n=1 Tax=Buchananella felis TaxID=3231492 RepID=UPI003527346F
MSFLYIWGWVCAVVGSLPTFPQISRIRKAGTTAGISALNWQLTAACFGGWVVHSFTVGAANMIAPNILLLVTSTYIVWLIAADRSQRPWDVLWPILATFAAIVAVRFAFGPVAFGIAVVVPQSVGLIGQIRDLVVRRDLTGVSLGYLVINLVLQAFWFSWGVLAHERGVITATSIMMVVAGATLATYLARRAGWQPASLREAR